MEDEQRCEVSAAHAQDSAGCPEVSLAATEDGDLIAATTAPLPSSLGAFIAAGVLPYCIDERGSAKFFLGKELAKGPSQSGKSKYCWSDFGGKRDHDLETPHETACREFSEETLGLWGGMGSLHQRIQQSIRNLQGRIKRSCFLGGDPSEGGDQRTGGWSESSGTADGQDTSRVFVLKNGLYVNFVLRLPYIDPLLFQLARDENDAMLAGETPDSDVCRAAEKRDWAWVDSSVLLSCVEGGVCRVADQDGQRLHLLPRLAVTLRAHLRLMLQHLDCAGGGGCAACLQLLVVPLEQQCRCIHLFDVRAGITAAEVRAAFALCAEGGRELVEKVTIYKDRNGKSNVFVLFSSAAAAVEAKGQALVDGAVAGGLWDRLGGDVNAPYGGAERVQYAWFEYGGGGEGPGRGPMKGGVQGAIGGKRRVARRKKLGVGLPTAPWARRRLTAAAAQGGGGGAEGQRAERAPGES